MTVQRERPPGLRVCRIDELGPGEVRRISDDPAVAVCNVDGELFAFSDTCTHEDYALSEGYLDGDVVECALHMAKYCVRDGKALCFPATGPLRTYPVRVVDGEVYVDVSSGDDEE